MKVAPLHRAFSSNESVESLIVHTGQHYDERMSDIFFNQLEMPKPHFYLGIGGGSHAYQTANVMLAFEKILLEEKPDIVLVVGDVNATVACSVTSIKLGIMTVHVEAGLRSGDRSMPEEVNRIITDSICDHLFVTEYSGLVNLAKENIPDNKVSFVGNVMIDSLIYYRKRASELSLKDITDYDLNSNDYILMTMHRPHNVDSSENLDDIIEIIQFAASKKKVVFPVHPRTQNNLKKYDLYDKLESIENLILLEPQGYLEFLKLMDNACIIITDSGGIQEETTYLQVPCLTFRDSTERPITVEMGTNILMSDLDPKTVKSEVLKILNGDTKKGIIPPLWDGSASYRILDMLLNL